MATYNAQSYAGLAKQETYTQSNVLRPYIRANLGYYTPLTDGDVIAVANTPKGTLLTGMRILFQDAFPADTLLTIGSLDQSDVMNVFVADIDASQAGKTVNLPMPLVGVNDKDGVQDTDPANGMFWGTTRLGVQFNGAGIDGATMTGAAYLILEYEYYMNGSDRSSTAIDKYNW